MAKSAGQQFRDRMDSELARVAGILGHELAWSPGEVELLDTIARDTDRRAALEALYLQCEDPGGSRALKIAQETRLIEAQVTRLVAKLQREFSKLLASRPSEDKPSPPSVVSLKASLVANTRWHRERLRQASIQQQYREPEVGG